MPPWKPLAGHEAFANGRRLTCGRDLLVRRWVAGGAPEGNAADLPAEPGLPLAGSLGEPDLIVTLPSTGRRSEHGPRYLFESGAAAGDSRKGSISRRPSSDPSNRRVVHHAVLYCDKSGRARQRDKEDEELGFQSRHPAGKLLPGPLAIWTPGRNPLPLRRRVVDALAQGRRSGVQLHLHPSGKPEVEQSSVGFYFYRRASRRDRWSTQP